MLDVTVQRPPGIFCPTKNGIPRCRFMAEFYLTLMEIGVATLVGAFAVAAIML